MSSQADRPRAGAGAIETASQDAHALVKVRDATIQELQDTIRTWRRRSRRRSSAEQSPTTSRSAWTASRLAAFSADLEERAARSMRYENADAVSKAHGEELAKAEAHRKQKLREAVKRAARVQALEGFLQAAKEAAVRRAEQDALAADRALAKAACAAAQFALELNNTWQGNSENDKREFAERFAAMEKARGGARDGRVALGCGDGTTTP